MACAGKHNAMAAKNASTDQTVRIIAIAVAIVAKCTLGLLTGICGCNARVLSSCGGTPKSQHGLDGCVKRRAWLALRTIHWKVCISRFASARPVVHAQRASVYIGTRRLRALLLRPLLFETVHLKGKGKGSEALTGSLW